MNLNLGRELQREESQGHDWRGHDPVRPDDAEVAIYGPASGGGRPGVAIR